MIAKLKGTIDFIDEDSFILDVNGVGYLVYAATRLLSRLQKGTGISVYTETVVREDSITLFGFADLYEKAWFNTLTKVQGVGAKVGLSILSILSPNQISQALAAADKNVFARASGVGPKLAQRIVTELKDKIVTAPIGADKTEMAKDLEMSAAEQTANYEDNLSSRAESPQAEEEAISALTNLGYARLEAYKAVNIALSKAPNADTKELIKLSLKEFATKEI